MKTEMVSSIRSKRQSINGKEFDTYKVATVANSCSTMHKIHEKEFTLEDFSCEHLKNAFDIAIPYSSNITSIYHYKEILKDTIDILNNARALYLETKDKTFWWQMIQLLPSSYNQTRNVMMNYEVLANIYKSRKNHKLDEWVEFCKWIETLPYAELICGNDALMTPNEQREKMGMGSLNEPEFIARIGKAIENYGKTDEVNDIIDKINTIGNPNPMTAEELIAAFNELNKEENHD